MSVSHESPEPPLSPIRWKKNAIFFVLTVLTTFAAGASQGELVVRVALESGVEGEWISLFPPLLYVLLSPTRWWEIFVEGFPFAATLLSILICHEFGHYFLARKHKVDASLPFFIPVPVLFIGTMGAVIAMRGQIKNRNALLDIGAAGPLAGLVIAIPAIFWGVAHSPVQPLPTDQGYLLEGTSLFYGLCKYLIHGPIPEGYDVQLSQVALAGWVGLFMTALNLLPIGQLDGGHIAYALLLKKHDRLSQVVHGSLFLSVPVLWLLGFGTVSNWAFFGLIILLLMRGFGPKHPPVTDADQPLSPLRVAIGVLCLIFFVLLIPPFAMTWIEP